MDTKFNWKADVAQVKPLYDQDEKVVSAVQWSCTVAADETYTTGGTMMIPAPREGDKYIPYNELTEADLIGWVKDLVKSDEVEADLDFKYQNRDLERANTYSAPSETPVGAAMPYAATGDEVQMDAVENPQVATGAGRYADTDSKGRK